jgi:diacylglycerol O-acyltransferase / wax synthase
MLADGINAAAKGLRHGPAGSSWMRLHRLGLYAKGAGVMSLHARHISTLQICCKSPACPPCCEWETTKTWWSRSPSCSRPSCRATQYAKTCKWGLRRSISSRTGSSATGCAHTGCSTSLSALTGTSTNCACRPAQGRRNSEPGCRAKSSEPLAIDRPLWQATLVHNIGSRSALLMRVHHSLADGMSLMNLVSRMTDVAQDTHLVESARSRERRDLSVGMLLRRAPRVLADAWQIIFTQKDRTHQLRGTLGPDKSVAWSEALSLATTRDIARRHHATANDVMLAVVAAALRQYLCAQRRTMIARPMLAAIPMNTRSRGDSHQVGNRFGFAGLRLPVHLADPLQRLRAVRDGMGAVKRGFQGELTLALMRCASVLPPHVQRLALGSLLHRFTAVITNVIGPAEERTVGGVRIHSLIGFVPPMAVGVGISILSYNDSVRICFLVDDKLMPNCLAAAASIRGCFGELRHACAGNGG